MQSEKCHNDYYVFAGNGDKGYYSLWDLEYVEGTKFFKLRNMGVDDEEVYLCLNHNSFKNLYHEGNYLFAGPSTN